MPIAKKTRICGIDFNNVTRAECLEYLSGEAARREGPLFIVTPNVDFIVRAGKDAEFRSLVNAADLSLCDSAIVLRASALLGKRLRGKITGSDASEMLLGLASERGEGAYLLGSRDETLRLAVGKLRERFPDLKIAGSHNGYFDESDSPALVEEINRSGARYLLIGMGSPRQEKWVERHRGSLENVRFIICIGGLFEVFSGNIKRAPRSMQFLGLEWAWRLYNDPKRLWKRYLVDDLVFFSYLMKDFLAARGGKSSTSERI
jgi:N-acetylglucosaminyldiphosphoundecaprenol N-acetyl-beta-D-mannosaminyltransferase